MKLNPEKHEVSFDKEANAIYISFNHAKVKKTAAIYSATKNIHLGIDLDKDNNVIGIELI